MVTRWLHEAPEDEQQAQAPATDAPEDAGNEAPAENEANPEGGEENAEDDEDFDIDTSLDGDEEEGGEEGGDEGEAPPEEAPAEDQGGSEEEEPVQANTDIFATLSAEEQQIKIGELKKLYKEMYSAVSDLIHRVDDMDLDENIMEPMTRISDILHQLQNSIADYFNNLFNIKSYFENDTKYNEFLLYLKQTATIVDDLAKSREKVIGKDSPNLEDKDNNI